MHWRYPGMAIRETNAMLIVQPHEQVDFAQNRQQLNRYRFVEYKLLRTLAGWLPATAALDLKLATMLV